MNQTPIIWGRYNGITSWSLERNGSDTINCLSAHYYNSEGGWVASGHILDHANFTTYVTPGAIGALPISGGTLTGNLTIPSNSKLTVYQVDFGSAYLYTDSNASFLGRTGPSTAYHYFQFNGGDGNLYIDGNKALHAANFTQHAISRWGDTMEGALNFKNATLNNLGDDCAFGDQDIAGAFCIKGLNGTTTLALLPYEGSTTIKLSSGGGGWVSLAGATTFSVGREVMVNGDAYPVFTLSNGSGTVLGAFGNYTANGAYGANYIRTYRSDGYHDFVFATDGVFHTKYTILEGNSNPWLALNDGNIQHCIQVYSGNLYIGPGTSEGIVYSPANQMLYKSANWWAYMTGYFDVNTATLYLQP